MVAAVAEIGLKLNGNGRQRAREIELQLPRYANLIHTTARRIEGVVEESQEDIEQLLWIKCHKALMAFDPARNSTPQDVYVYHCIARAKIDILRGDKGQKRQILYIDDVRGATHPDAAQHGDMAGRIDLAYLSVGAERVYAEIERELPLIPSTLTHIERHVLVLMYDDYTNQQIQRALGLKRKELKEAIARIQQKCLDWAPDGWAGSQMHVAA